MKINPFIITAIIALSAVTNSCRDDEFLVSQPLDSYIADEFYNSDTQVIASTNHLYGKAWFNYYNKAVWAITEMGAGNAFSYSSDITSFKTFDVFSTNERLSEAWKSNFAVIAQSNALMNNLAVNAGANVTVTVKNNAIAEARLMRAVAYFNLVRLWGPVPIIEDNTTVASNPKINTNPIADVYKFIENDLIFASENLVSKVRGSNYAANGHVSKGTANALLAKVYLYEKKYDLAKAKAQEVINSGEFKLYGGSSLPTKSYADLFLTANNNNEESILAIQWAVTGVYGTGNNCNTQFAYSSLINASTFGGVFAPSMDLINNGYVTGDLRRKETFMLPNDHYSNILSSQGGFTVPTTINAQNTGSGIKKYVVGKATDSHGGADEWGMMANNTYLMRYADLLLIYAEATMGVSNNTADATAVSVFNQVRNRAGLPSVTNFTKADLFQERRKEFAFEAEYWFDLGRLPKSEAISILSAQNRGDASTPVYYTPTESDLMMPYPDAEVAKNPKLLETPVPYQF